jgi:GNAT superfamily N-acetyltransferase
MIYSREWKKADFVITTDKTRLQPEAIHAFLSDAYWAKGISLQQVKQAIANSICFGLLHQDKQIGFARVITDQVSLGYLCDVYVEQAYRGQGLGKWMVETVFSNQEFKNFRRWLLATRDAHSLYTQAGFSVLSKPENLMELFDPDAYMNGHSRIEL